MLELWDTPDVEMKAVLEPYLPQLHFLGLMHLNRTSAYVPSQSSNLKELVVLRLPVPEILSLDKILPQSLEHFGVVNEPYSEQTKVAWSPVLKVLETLPNLQFFSCDRKTARIADSNRIGEICSQRSIQLRVFPYKPDQQERWPVSTYNHCRQGNTDLVASESRSCYWKGFPQAKVCVKYSPYEVANDVS